MNFYEEMRAAARAYDIELTEDQLSAYQQYYELLVDWNGKMNLTAITEPRQVAVKHMIDSVSCYTEEAFGGDAKVIDVGAGAGFPGLPLKIWKKGLRMTLLDSLNKRVKFLNEVIGALSLNHTEALHGRAEDYAQNTAYRESFDIAVSRAVSRLSVLCEYCLPFVRKGGYFIALKGSKYHEEILEAKYALRMLGGEIEKVASVQLPGIDDKRAVIYIKKAAATPMAYPRKAGIPEKTPLL